MVSISSQTVLIMISASDLLIISGGNPLVCQTALTVLKVIEKDGILNNAIQMGEYFLSTFKSKLANSNKIVEIRAKGLMLAIELNQDCSSLLNAALDKKLLINITGQSIRLLPVAERVAMVRP